MRLDRPDAFEHWTQLRAWIGKFYPGVFEPDWLYGRQNARLVPTIQEDQGVLHALPEYSRLSAVVVFGGAEREKFEERRYAWRPPLIKLYDESKTYIDGKWPTVAISWDLKEVLAMKRPSALARLTPQLSEAVERGRSYGRLCRTSLVVRSPRSASSSCAFRQCRNTKRQRR